jgi:hypothetical protein
LGLQILPKTKAVYPTKSQPDWLHLTSIRERCWFDILAGSKNDKFSLLPDIHHVVCLSVCLSVGLRLSVCPGRGMIDVDDDGDDDHGVGGGDGEVEGDDDGGQTMHPIGTGVGPFSDCLVALGRQDSRCV